jgi:hypothetical protein
LGWFCDKRGGYWGLGVSFCFLEVVGEHSGDGLVIECNVAWKRCR